MKCVSLPLLALLAVVVSRASSQVTGNYLLAAYEASMELKETFDYWAEYYRDDITYEADDYSNAFTNRIANAVQQATTAEHGLALMRCADTAADQAQEAIENFHNKIRDLKNASHHLHQSVWVQLLDWNIKDEEVSLFYYYHSLRLDEAYANFNTVLLPAIHVALLHMEEMYYVISLQLDSCIASAL